MCCGGGIGVDGYLSGPREWKDGFVRRVGGLEGITVVTRISRNGAALISRLLGRDNAFHTGRSISREMVSSGSLRERHNVAVLSGGADIVCNSVGVGVISAPNRTSFNNRIRHVLRVISNMLLLISTFRNYVPRAHFILGGTLTLNGGTIIMMGGVSEPVTEPRRIISRILSLFVRLKTSSRRVRFPMVFTSNHSNCTSCSPSVGNRSVGPLFSTVIGRVSTPGNSMSNPLRVLFAGVRCSSCLNHVNINHIVHKRIGDNRRITIYRGSNARGGRGVTGLFVCHNLGERRRRGTDINSVVRITNLTSLRVNRATYSTGGVRTLPFIGVSRPALSVGFVIGGSPFTNGRNGFIASHGLHSHLFGRIVAGMDLHIRRASSTSAFGISNENRLRLSVLVRAVHHRNCRFRISPPRIVCGHSRGKGLLRPVRLLVVRMPRRCINTIVRHLNAQGTRVGGVNAHSNNISRLRFSVPTEKLLNCHSRFVASAGNGNVVGRMFSDCRRCGNSVRRHLANSVVTRRANRSAKCNLFGARDQNHVFVKPKAPICRNVVVNRGPGGRSVIYGIYGGGRVAGAHTSKDSSTLELMPRAGLDLRRSLRFVGSSRLIRVAPRGVHLHGEVLNGRREVGCRSGEGWCRLCCS